MRLTSRQLGFCARVAIVAGCLPFVVAEAGTDLNPMAVPPPPTPPAVLAAFASARENPLLLHAFLRRMPKGGDLHMHLSGAVYAETLLADAARDELCVDPQLLMLLEPMGRGQDCASGQIPASAVSANQPLYDRLVDSFSVRGFVASPGFNGHDQFFAAFDHFRALGDAHLGEWLAEVANRAGAQNESYLEIMHTPDFHRVASIAEGIGRSDVGSAAAQLGTLRTRLFAAGLRAEVPAIRQEIRDAESQRDALENCTKASGKTLPSAGCSVHMRYLFQVLRGYPPEVVFAQALLGFETVAAEAASGQARYVGINFVMPEDGVVAMRDYHLHMLMIDYLHSLYPEVRIALHAGEVAPGLVRPEGLRFHIREAVELGHAKRIGHGVDVMYEDDPNGLLAEMAHAHVMLEINLTSNDVILGVTGKNHPLIEYLAAGVPVAFSTDDEGVSRIDLTHEYVRAVMDFGLDYAALKKAARTSLEHSFVPGPSLWAAMDTFDVPVRVCSDTVVGFDRPGGACAAFVHSSEKASLEWNLESRLRDFESTFQ